MTQLLFKEKGPDGKDQYTRLEYVDRNRQVLDEPHNAIRVAVEQTVRLGVSDIAELSDAYVTALTKRLNDDRDDGVLSGPASDSHPGQTRKFLRADVQWMIALPEFEVMLEQAQREEQRRIDLLETQKREAGEAKAKVAAEIARERELCPHVFSMVEELKAEVADLRRGEIDGRNLRSPLLRN